MLWNLFVADKSTHSVVALPVCNTSYDFCALSVRLCFAAEDIVSVSYHQAELGHAILVGRAVVQGVEHHSQPDGFMLGVDVGGANPSNNLAQSYSVAIVIDACMPGNLLYPGLSLSLIGSVASLFVQIG